MGLNDVSSGLAGLLVVFTFFSIALFIVHILVCVWAYRDALRKGKSQEYGLLVVLGIFFFPVLGIIVYLLIRNDGNSRYRY